MLRPAVDPLRRLASRARVAFLRSGSFFAAPLGRCFSYTGTMPDGVLGVVEGLRFPCASASRLAYEDAAGSCFDLGRFQRDVLKAGGRVVQQTRRLVLRVARVVTPFWRQLVDRLATLVAAKPPRDPDRPAPARVDAAATPRLPPRGPPRVTPPALSRHLHTQHRARRTTQGKGATAHQPRPFAARNKHTLNS
jgi:hypothetical protein